ncbi:MAG: thiamine phosphate synthase [Vulcanimicrobiaceae bacterium]
MLRDERLRGLYAIIDRAATAEPLPLLAAVLAGGGRVVQYRAKDGVDPALVRAMHRQTRPAGALLIVNDDLAAALDADGWHAGQEDLLACDVAQARARLGERLFGVSCGTAPEAVAAAAAGADYVGTGPFAGTATKADAGAPIGVAGVAAVVAAVSRPVVAIGGIDLENLAAVRASGAHMFAVISALATAADPERRTRELVARWESLR